ncbi:hypothetical protein LCM23_06755 [Cytobacillus kochii]|uniref:hypothetical protein n=1 Tax=Cytobacillus kochii TaxID=859143 RepID=UPI001CD422D9|nr:hypothetical protein [Cytobacillus kochii]MCA1025787.1 hypothetical protein [Cytobacillus kochii]
MSTKIVAVEADKNRHLKYGVNQLIEIEEMLGRSVTELGTSTGIKDLRTIMYVGLRWEDKELNEEKTGDIMDSMIEKHGMDYVSEKLAKAMEKASSKSFPS